MARSKKPRGSVKLEVSVDLEDVRGGEEAPQLAAYAFTPGGALIGEAEVEKGSATFELRGREEAQAVRVVVGPRRSGDEEAELAELLRLNATERMIRLEPRKAVVETEIAVLRPDWLCWLLNRCTVRGTLLKRVHSGGVPIDMPVCDAEVEIYEVDPIPILVPRIPDDIIDRIRVIVRWPPPPPPPPDPGPIGPRPPEPPEPPGPWLARVQELFSAAQRGVAPLGAQPSEGDFVSRRELAQLAEGRFGQSADGPAERERTVALVPEPVEAPGPEEAVSAIRALAGSEAFVLAANRGNAAFRSALIRNPELTRPFICALFPHFVTKQRVATATTDECGHFHATFSQGCSSDKPDLYFVAYRRIFSLRFPIYEPLPVSCHTHWDYVCGTEVTLYTSHPLARTCPPCRPVVAAPNWVLVMAIGNTPLSRIHGTGATLGTTTGNVGLTDWGAPFGGLLRLRLEFDNALRDDLGVGYYRVSWRRAGTGNPWLPLELEVHRHYAHWVGSSLVLEVYPLGPRVIGAEPGLFEIPPALPPLGQWSLPDAVEDSTSAKFPTGGSRPGSYGLVPPGAEGLYELRVELFDNGGAPVDIGSSGIHFVVPTSTDLSSTIDTADAAALGLVPGAPIDSGSAFVMQVHVDNNPTAASIAPPLLNGGTGPDPKCGVIGYAAEGSDTLTVAYTASHPHGFATYDFVLERGVNVLAPPTESGPVGAGSFSSAPAVSALLDGCSVAGFAERLYVRGTATDGWSRQGYDAEDLRAFVLKPK